MEWVDGIWMSLVPIQTFYLALSNLWPNNINVYGQGNVELGKPNLKFSFNRNAFKSYNLMQDGGVREGGGARSLAYLNKLNHRQL